MTCIIGLTTGAEVIMGGDSAAIDDWDHAPMTAPKVFERGPYVIGYTTSFRMGQLLQHTWAPPNPTGDELAFMCTVFIDSVRELLKAAGWIEREKDRESGGSFLVGVNGRLFVVTPEFAVLEPYDGYQAIGIGSTYAMGAMHRLGTTKDPEMRVRLALLTARTFSAGVRQPFDVIRGGRLDATSVRDGHVPAKASP